jgi:Ca2+-binding RTX toxin-like protein
MAIVEGTESSETLDQWDGVTYGSDRIYGYGGVDTIYGLNGDDEIYGGEGDDWIYGQGNNDVLKGGGGADHLFGGTGTDWASYADAPTGISVALSPWLSGATGIAAGDTFDSIENLSGSNYNDNLTGDDDANALAGQAGQDWLQGLGGADSLEGGTGSDTASYYFSPVGVFVSLITGMGFNGHAAGDRLNGIENLAGSALHDDLLVGNDNANSLWGEGGHDNLKGAGGVDTLSGHGGDDLVDGGSGRDWMYGGTHNDTYIVDDFFDNVREHSGEGSDTVRASVSYALSGTQDVEFLTTTDDAGTAGLSLSGNAAGNVVRGNAGNNTLNGGDGNDDLIGLGGVDWFVFDTVLDATWNVDTITGFNVPDDTIRLDATIFSSDLTPGSSVATSQFVVGEAAQDAGDRIIYSNATGAVYYDSDGTGMTSQIRFAQLDPGLADPTDLVRLDNFDFFVVA